MTAEQTGVGSVLTQAEQALIDRHVRRLRERGRGATLTDKQLQGLAVIALVEAGEIDLTRHPPAKLAELKKMLAGLAALWARVEQASRPSKANTVFRQGVANAHNRVVINLARRRRVGDVPAPVPAAATAGRPREHRSRTTGSRAPPADDDDPEHDRVLILGARR